jgi:hypothetical protein
VFIALPPSSSTEVFLRNYDTTGNSSTFANVTANTLTSLIAEDPRVDIILAELPEFSASISASQADIAQLQTTASNTIAAVLDVANNLDDLSGSFSVVSSSISSSFENQSASFASGISNLSLTVSNNSSSFAVEVTTLSSSVETTSASLNSFIQTVETTYATTDYTVAQISTDLSSSFTNGIASQSLASEISTVNTTISNTSSSLASSITNLNSSFTSASSSFNASIQNIETTYATQDQATSIAGQTISASFDPLGIASASLAAAVSTEASARATADGFLAGQYTLEVEAGDIVTGMKITSATTSGTPISDITFRANNFKVVSGSGTPVVLLDVKSDNIVFQPDVQSDNYSLDTAGWKIKNNGDAEFNDVKVRGTLESVTVSTVSSVFNPARPAVTFPTVTNIEELDSTARTSLGSGGTIIDLVTLNGFDTGGTGFREDVFGKSDVHVFISTTGGYDVAIGSAADTDILYKINSGSYEQVNQVSARSTDNNGQFNLSVGTKITGLDGSDVLTFAIKAKSANATTQFNAVQMTVQCFNL